MKESDPFNLAPTTSGSSALQDPSSHGNRLLRALTVSQLNRQVKSLLEASYSPVWVKGELSGLSRPGSGHWYFSLKDERAQIRCAMFRGFNQRLKFQPKDGDQLIIRGKASLYEGRGDYQLIVEDIEPAGLGQLQAAFEALKLKLSAAGLFDPAHKQPLPKIPRKLAVVTSATGAVIHDIINVSAKRFPHLEILLVPVRVQGEGAAQEIAQAIELINKRQLADIMIVGRGGGSLEDLWAFNEEVVAYAIHDSNIPVVSAVGHEVDFTIADLVADYRAPTPSAAAEAITPDQFELMQLLDQQTKRLQFMVGNLLHRLTERLEARAKRLKSPSQSLAEKKETLQQQSQRMKLYLQHRMQLNGQRLQSARNALAQFNPEAQIRLRQESVRQCYSRLRDLQREGLKEQQHRLSMAAQTLNTTSPLATLGRGYAIAFDAQRQIIKDPAVLTSGDALSVKVEKGEIDCIVK